MNSKISTIVVDDEQLAINRLVSMLEDTGRVHVLGSASKPDKAIELIEKLNPDLIFLDIKMPGTTGFQLLDKLDPQPPVIFTTAFSEHSLDAFDYFSIDYLVKPIEKARLDAAIEKAERVLKSESSSIEEIVRELNKTDSKTTTRISSRVGSKVVVLNIDEITHFYSEDKVSFAVTVDGRSNPIEQTLNSLETSLDSNTFLRIHRATIVNLDYVDELHGWFSGGMMLRLKDSQKTELNVARARVKELRSKLGL